MLVLGLVLIALAAVVIIIFVFAGANDGVVLGLGNLSWDTNAMGIFLCGVAATVLLGAGLYLLQNNARRAHRRRKANKAGQPAPGGAATTEATGGDPGSPGDTPTAQDRAEQ